MRELANTALRALTEAGAQMAQVQITRSQQTEINIQDNMLTLMRTSFTDSAQLTAIIDRKKGTLAVNQLSEEALAAAAREVAGMAAASQPDDANTIADLEPGETRFESGPSEADKGAMMDRITELLDWVKATYPGVKLEGFISFSASDSAWANTNGVAFDTRDGRYGLQITFTATEGERSASMNGIGALSRDLDKPLKDVAGLGLLIEQNVRELEAKPLEAKFTGDIILYPACAQEFMGMYLDAYLRTMPLMSGTSLLKDKLGQKVASGKLTVTSCPTKEGVCGFSITSDGFRAGDLTVIEDGVLKSFVVSQYGALKTGQPRSANTGEMAEIAPGTTALNDLIGQVERGLLICRFSGGAPSDSGDFSGVAKNSFYIENGRLQYPVNETMISGNLLKMFNAIEDISADTLSDGQTAQPWVRLSGIGISG